MKPLVIYHANCADGFGAAFAAWRVLGDNAEYLPLQYGFKTEDLSPDGWLDREVYLLDFSLPKPLMQGMFGAAKRAVWLDHHKTGFEMWCGKARERYEPTCGTRYSDENYVLLDNNKSGAYLAWEYFHPGKPVPMLIQHIDDYDRWQFKLRGTKEFIKVLWSRAPWSFDQWVDAMGDTDFFANDGKGIDAWYREGAAILRSHDQNVRSVVDSLCRACRITIETERYGCTSEPGLSANCPAHLVSDVGHALATQSGTFGLCWTLGKNDLTVNCSLRSNGDYDVSEIAKSFGGGGHRNAAGFEVPIETLLEWMK